MLKESIGSLSLPLTPFCLMFENDMMVANNYRHYGVPSCCADGVPTKGYM